MPEGREAPHPCGHAERQRGCGGCDPGAVEFVIEDGTGEVTRFCCMERDRYGECSHVQAGRERSVADLAMEQGVEPFNPDTFQSLDLTDEEREGLDAALAAGRETTWTIEAEGFDCPLCFHGVEMHDGESCTAPEGYDHLNGSHECGCPLTPPARHAVQTCFCGQPDDRERVHRSNACVPWATSPARETP